MDRSRSERADHSSDLFSPAPGTVAAPLRQGRKHLAGREDAPSIEVRDPLVDRFQEPFFVIELIGERGLHQRVGRDTGFAGDLVEALGQSFGNPDEIVHDWLDDRRSALYAGDADDECGKPMPYPLRIENAHSPMVVASNAIALSASDQWTPIKLPSSPTVTPLKARRPLFAVL